MYCQRYDNPQAFTLSAFHLQTIDPHITYNAPFCGILPIISFTLSTRRSGSNR